MKWGKYISVAKSTGGVEVHYWKAEAKGFEEEIFEVHGYYYPSIALLIVSPLPLHEEEEIEDCLVYPNVTADRAMYLFEQVRDQYIE